MRVAPATPVHDASLRALSRAAVQPGWVRLRFDCEPSFFDAAAVQGFETEVVAAFEGETVRGVGCRSLRRVYLDGRPTVFGYLGGLRIDPAFRSGTLLGRGFRWLRERHGDGRTPGYLTAIVERNRAARDLLIADRPLLPRYLPLGRYTVYAMPARRRPARRTRERQIRSGADIGLDALLAFLAAEGSRKPFFPVIEPTDFGRPLLRGLRLEDFRVAVDGAGIAGAVAAWDQTAFRQTVIEGYAPWAARLRPVANAVLARTGFPTLPPPGSTLRIASLAFLCTRGNAPDIAADLLAAVREERGGDGPDLYGLGLHADDALNAALAGVRAWRYGSRLYVACWDDTIAACRRWASGQAPHVELAMM